MLCPVVSATKATCVRQVVRARRKLGGAQLVPDIVERHEPVDEVGLAVALVEVQGVGVPLLVR